MSANRLASGHSVAPGGMGFLDRLIADGKIPAGRREDIVVHAVRAKSSVGESILELGVLEEQDFLKHLASTYRTRFVSTDKLEKAAVNKRLLNLIPRKLADQLCAFPIIYDREKRSLVVVAADPTMDVAGQVRFATNTRDVKVYVAREAAVRALIEKHYDGLVAAFDLLMERRAARAGKAMRGARRAEQEGWGGALNDNTFEEQGGQLIAAPSQPAGPGRDTSISWPVRPITGTSGAAPWAGSSVPAPMVQHAPAPPPAPGLMISARGLIDTLKLLVSMHEQNDAARKGHSGWVEQLAVQLADRMRLPSERVEAIQIASCLHDLGKPSGSHVTPLAAAESADSLASAKRSAFAPVRLFDSIDLPRVALDLLGAVYERFDGKGFPNRTSGKEIPLESRILAVAESYIDLTRTDANHVGQKLAADKAVALLEKHKSTVFDPTVLDWLRQVVLDDEAQAVFMTTGQRALLVDPDPEETAVLEVRLTAQGFDVAIARGQQAAMEEIRAGVDIVVTEVELADGDGFSLLKALQASANRDTPVMFLSSLGDSTSVSRGLDAGAADFVIKPISPQVVAAKLRRIIDGGKGGTSSGRGVSGSLSEMSLPDVLQILSGGRKTGRLTVRSGGASGEMIFCKGWVFDARFGASEGAEAVTAMLALRDGEFALEPGEEVGENKIGMSTEALLLEAMRQLDESNR